MRAFYKNGDGNSQPCRRENLRRKQDFIEYTTPPVWLLILASAGSFLLGMIIGASLK